MDDQVITADELVWEEAVVQDGISVSVRPKPMVIRRGDDYVVINIPDLDTLGVGQRVGIGVLVWEQMKWLMNVNGESTSSPQSVDKRVAEALKFGHSSLTSSRYAMKRDGWKYLDSLIDGQLDVAKFLRKSGIRKGVPQAAMGPIAPGKDGALYFGKGDRFDDAVEPLRRYLAAWKHKGFEFRHLPPREAKRRLPTIRELIANLQAAEKDLEGRSHSATLRAPHERKERHQ